MASKIYYDRVSPFRRGRAQENPLGGADVVYDIGKQTLPKDATVLVPFLSAEATCETKYVWDTSTRQRVQTLLVAKNPLKQPICPAAVSVFRGDVRLANDVSEWTPPGRELVLRAGVAAGIEVERSVVTSENLGMKGPRFNHAIKFKAANTTREPVVVEVLFTKKLGSRHRTEYHFRKEPDKRPGTLFIWVLNLAPGGAETIEFDFDSDQARYSEYELYERARYSL